MTSSLIKIKRIHQIVIQSSHQYRFLEITKTLIFLLKTHTGYPLVIYANNGKLYKQNCKIIELYFKELQIKYKSDNNEEREVF